VNTIGYTAGTMPNTVAGVITGVTTPIAALALGSRFTCLQMRNGSVKCWGVNTSGQLGLSTTVAVGDDELPSSAGFAGLSGPVMSVGAGDLHACAITADNVSLSCWGLNTNGQLGYGGTASVGDNEYPSQAGFVQWQAPSPSPTSSATPSTTATPSKSLSVTSSSSTSVTPSATASATLVPVLPLQIAQVSAGQSHTCILVNNGSVMCWGQNDNGKLGYGHGNIIGDDEYPFSAGFVDTGSVPIRQISVGQSHSCALTTNGSVMCWGYNSYGALGYGHVNNIGDNELPASAGYVRVPGGVSATQVIACCVHTCSLAANGSVSCWGFNSNGNLGLGHTNHIGDDEHPSAAGYAVLGLPIKLLSSGPLSQHTCALATNSSVVCWGFNGDGQLGYGHVNNIGDNEYPSSVGYVRAGVIFVFADIRSGFSHTCALDTVGRVKYV
jgi:hypothetical protein